MEAIVCLEEHEYDIIISDYFMPELSGIELLKKFRSTNSSIPFIIHTGHGDEMTAIEALQCGADFFLEKGTEGSLQYLTFTQIINLLVSKHKIERKMQKLNNLFQCNRDGFLYVTLDGTIRDVNPGFLEMTGYTEVEIKYMPLNDIINEEWIDKEIQALKDDNGSENQSGESHLDFFNGNGDIIPFSIRSQVVKNQNNEPEGMWIIVQDISRFSASSSITPMNTGTSDFYCKSE